MFWKDKRVLVTGARGFVGQHLVPRLTSAGASLVLSSRGDHDLREQAEVRRLVEVARPQVVFHLAGLVGGILANKRSPANYWYDNLVMGTTMLHEAWRAGAEKYVTLIGGCSYPATAPSPIAETELWNGYPQSESAPYSLAKRMAVVGAQAYRAQHGFNAIVLAPGNLYGPFDNFDLESSHVIPALIRKFTEAIRDGRDEVPVWGSGRPLRDFVYVEDACDAIMIAAERYDDADIINISSGDGVRIRDLATAVAEAVGYKGRISWDASKPDGQMEKAFDVTRMKARLGYECRTSLQDGLRKTVDWFEAHHDLARLKVNV